jgi:hypothetical protein
LNVAVASHRRNELCRVLLVISSTVGMYHTGTLVYATPTVSFILRVATPIGFKRSKYTRTLMVLVYWGSVWPEV